jgi:predicted CoA-binding protein
LKDGDAIEKLLRQVKTIAVVGLSDQPMRPSHGVSSYMQAAGYRVVPVNPEIEAALGEKAHASLMQAARATPEGIDLVNVFRRPEYVDEIVEQAIQLKIPAIWLQEGVVNQRAAERARGAGMFVVMDLCILKEHRLRFS